MNRLALVAAVSSLVGFPALASAQPANSPTYARMKAYLDSVPAIDTHDHLWPFDKLPGYVETENGKGMNLAGLWRNSYLSRVKPVAPWTPGGKFADWYKTPLGKMESETEAYAAGLCKWVELGGDPISRRRSITRSLETGFGTANLLSAIQNVERYAKAFGCGLRMMP